MCQFFNFPTILWIVVMTQGWVPLTIIVEFLSLTCQSRVWGTYHLTYTIFSDPKTIGNLLFSQAFHVLGLKFCWAYWTKGITVH